jgi:tetratricopeptide (TPR) repeat protein
LRWSPARQSPGVACIRLDPRAPFLVNRLNQVALAHYFCRDYEASVEAAERAIRSFPDFPSPHRWLAAALGELGRTAEARHALAKAVAISPASFDFQVRDRPPGFGRKTTPPCSTASERPVGRADATIAQPFGRVRIMKVS